MEDKHGGLDFGSKIRMIIVAIDFSAGPNLTLCEIRCSLSIVLGVLMLDELNESANFEDTLSWQLLDLRNTNCASISTKSVFLQTNS